MIINILYILIIWLQARLQPSIGFTSGRHNSAVITDRRKLTTKWYPSTVCLFLFLPLESIQSHSPGLYTPYRKPPQIFCDVRRGLDFCQCPTFRNRTV